MYLQVYSFCLLHCLVIYILVVMRERICSCGYNPEDVTKPGYSPPSELFRFDGEIYICVLKSKYMSLVF